MTTKQAEEIVRFMNDNLNCKAEVCRDYSGRGMGGKTTAAIVADNAVALGYAAGRVGLQDGDLPMRRDTMGYSSVFY